MSSSNMVTSKHGADTGELGSVLLATGLTLVSMILLPALAGRVGLGPSMTLALRGVFMRASGRV